MIDLQWLHNHPTEVFECITKLEVENRELRAQAEQLKYELTLSTDQNDLLLDEFVRVKLLTKNKEIHQLCERAHIRMRQRVSVIERNFNQAQKIKELKAHVEALHESKVYFKNGMAELQNYIDKMEPEYDALAAQVEQMRDLLIRAVKSEQYIIESDLIAAIDSDLQSEISEAIDATPSQCLAEVKAQAVEDAINACTHCGSDGQAWLGELEQYVIALQSKAGE